MNWHNLIIHPDDEYVADVMVSEVLCTTEYALVHAMDATKRRYHLPDVDLALAHQWRMRFLPDDEGREFD